jgi:hypothetical protein
MIDSPYLTEIQIRRKIHEITIGAEDARIRSLIAAPPSPLRRALAAAIVRFGIFLNGGAYHCPGSCDPAMEARTTA